MSLEVLQSRISASLSMSICLANRIYCDAQDDLLGCFERVSDRVSSDLLVANNLTSNLTSFSFVGYRSQDSRASLNGLTYLNLKWFLHHFTLRRVQSILSGIETFSIRSYVIELVLSDSNIDDSLAHSSESLDFIVGVYIVFFNTIHTPSYDSIEVYRRFLNELSIQPRLI